MIGQSYRLLLVDDGDQPIWDSGTLLPVRLLGLSGQHATKAG